MTEPPKPFELYKLYLATAEKVSDRRAAANQWLLTVNGAIAGFYGYLEVAGANAARLVIPVAGILICLAWVGLLSNYKKLNGAKFAVLHEMEADFPFQPFATEQTQYEKTGRGSLAQWETLVPSCFAMLYLAMLVIAFARTT